MPKKSSPSSDQDLHLSLLRAYIDSANDGIFVVCDEMKFHVANRLLVSWLGESEAVLTTHNRRLPITYFFSDDKTRRLFVERFKEVLTGNPVRFQCRLQPKHGEPRWVEINMNKVGIEAGELVIGVVRDTTEHMEMMAVVQHYARYDDLTGLVNRREFEQKLKELFDDAKRQHSRHVLLYLDLDQFKLINDTCGHMAGDELLRQLSSQTREIIRFNDTFARLGGDEFGVLLEDCSTDLALGIAEKIRQTIGAIRFRWKDRSFDIGVSIGACAITEKSESPADILSNADAACYVAKDNGRNRVQLYFGGQDCFSKRAEMDWVARLTRAMEDKRLCLYYQKIFPLNAAKANAEYFEVLLRLVDETGTIVTPGVFLPSAEKYNLMPAIDRWVVSHVLSRHDEWWARRAKIEKATDEINISCSINLSGASLNDDRFPAFLQEQIASSQIPPQALCFEITETVAITNLQRALSFMRELKEIGCHIALDDFGSGMSSYAYLKSLPIDILKIDGALIKNVAQDQTDLAMVESINRIGHLMGLQTVAEYVENDEILKKLRDIDVDFVQGAGLHRPELL
ncbi:MAG: EAL domain-containing protein [Gammaproteobacteria bacterium]|nr:EAL domain-containing protein [Gammaproteobacteria bacterium]